MRIVKRRENERQGGGANEQGFRLYGLWGAGGLDALRLKITNHVGGKSMEMVKTATEECVKVGNLSALKYLFEVIGLYPLSPTAAAEESDSDDLGAGTSESVRVWERSGSGG